MFNDKSTHNERQEALQTVMRKGDADVGEQVHSAPQLNKLLARSTEEFNIFQQVQHLPMLAIDHRNMRGNDRCYISAMASSAGALSTHVCCGSSVWHFGVYSLVESLCWWRYHVSCVCHSESSFSEGDSAAVSLPL